jgi:predicted PurR-regulated permease PerM
VVSFDPDFVETNDPEQTASDNQGNAAPSGNQGNAAPSGNQGNAASGEDESTEPSQATLARQASLGDQAPMGLQLDGASIREPMQIDDQFNPDYKASFEETAGSLIRVGLMRVSGALLEIFSTSVVVLIYVFFILLGSADAPRAYASIQAVDRQVRSYLMMKTIISIFTGVAFGVALAAFGVPMALTFGLLAFLLNYIPNVGPVVASLLPIPFILLGDGSAAWMVSAIVVTMSIQIISGNVVEPKLMGDTSDLHPVVILLALMFWGMMWGVTGMFLATPITAGLKIVLEGNEVSRPMSDLLAGRWGSSDKAAKTEGSNGGHGSSVAKA